MHTPTPGSTLPTHALNPRLHEALTDLAAAVQRRAIYPAGHPVLRGAVTAVWERVSACIAEIGGIDLGVGGRSLVSGSTQSDPSHPLLGDLAARLAAHRVGGIRLLAGVSTRELGDLIEYLSTSPDAAGVVVLAQRTDLTWNNIQVRAVAFDRLGLVGEAEGSVADQSSAAAWRALAGTAFLETDGEIVSPAAVAAALLEQAADQESRVTQFEAFLQSVGGSGEDEEGVAHAVAVIESLGRTGLARVFTTLGELRTRRVVAGAVDRLPVSATVDLVQAANDAHSKVVATSLLRMLQKVGDAARRGHTSRRGDRLLQLAVRRLLHEWTLESPNPEAYEQALATVSHARDRGSDLRRDTVEPERTVDLGLETGASGSAVDAALGRLALRDGLANTLAFLSTYPASGARERLIDRLVNESSVREHLSHAQLDVAFLRQSVDRLRHRAAIPIMEALQRRPDSDADLLVELLQRIGWDALGPIGERTADAPPRVHRALVTLFDTLDAWPPQVDPLAWMMHPDFIVRRETIKHLLKGSATRDAATLAALKDQDVRIVAVGLHAISGACSPAAAREVMHRYTDPGFTTELRVRAIRAVAPSRTNEVATWLAGLTRRRRRWFGGSRLAKASPETLSAVSALAQWYPRHPAATEVLQLAEASRAAEYRRAALTKAGTPNA